MVRASSRTQHRDRNAAPPRWREQGVGGEGGDRASGCLEEINAKTQRCKDAKEDPVCFGSGSQWLLHPRHPRHSIASSRPINLNGFSLFESKLARRAIPGDTITGTTIHPVWSVDRQEWVPLAELGQGERLSCGTESLGLGFLSSLTPQACSERLPFASLTAGLQYRSPRRAHLPRR